MEWKPECDILLLQEIIVSEPYNYKASTRERGKIWDEITETERLNASDAFANKLKQKRAVRDRYSLLAKKYKKKMTDEETASGISPEMSEMDKLLEQIIERFEESDREAADRADQADRGRDNERKKAEEMRKRSMEKLGETMKRKADEDQGESCTPKKRASGSETIVYLKEKAEKDFDLRKEELEIKKKDHDQQSQMFLYMQQQLQQQQQQQHQQLQLQHQQQQLQTQLLMALIEKLNK